MILLYQKENTSFVIYLEQLDLTVLVYI